MKQQGMYVREWGSGDKIALLIHGLASSSLTWRRFAKDLEASGYKVLAPDLKGHGRSENLSAYSLDAWTQDIIDLDIKPSLIVGHSIGGLIAANVQQKLHADQIVLIDPVFRLSKNKLVLKTIQSVFSNVMLNRTRPRNHAAAKLRNIDNARIELIEISQWDILTTSALKPFKAPIIQCLLGNKDVLLMRPKGSFILPTSIMKKTFNNNIFLRYFHEVGHNIHSDAYDTFWTNVKEFIYNKKEELLHNGNLLPLTPTMQNLPQSV